MSRSSGHEQAEAGVLVKDLFRKAGFSEATFYDWRSKFGGMDASDARRLRELEAENRKLKKLLAEAHLDMYSLKAVLGVRRLPPGKAQGGLAAGGRVRLLELRACPLVGRRATAVGGSSVPIRSTSN